MKRKNAVPWLELGDVGANLVDDSGDIIASVRARVVPFWDLPVLGIGAADHDLDDDLVVVGLWDGRVHDGHLGACAKRRGCC